ncbi:response regulator [Sporosarcina sp. NPDC096371]|uniref:response regulator transcription factor n=1 Tax=Sporosarcina sp. NPDC096371 TaxID=3364530 RepID=UPI003807E78B
MPKHHFCKVLIVDDELLIRQGIKHSINWEQEGFQIIGEASNGKEALELIEQIQPHIVITDMVMPVMDGEELTRIIKGNYPQIEIIILSSFGDFDYVRSTFQHGITDYILKPQLEEAGLLKVLKATVDKIPGFILPTKDRYTVNSMEKMIDKIMMGYGFDEDDSIIMQSLPHSQYCLFGVDFKNRGKQKLSDLQSITRKVENEIHRGLPHITYQFVPADQDISVFLLNFEPHQLESIKQFIKMIAVSLTFSEFNLGWALTKPFLNFHDIKTNYQEELVVFINHRFYFPDTTVLIYDEIPKAPKIEDRFQLAKFTEAFKRQQFKVAFQSLDEHIQILVQQYTNDEFVFKSFLNNIIFNITTLLGNMEYKNIELDQTKYAYFSAIDGAMIATDALTHFESFLAEVSAVIAENPVHPNLTNMNRLLDYIDENYEKPLNLTVLADHFHYNPSYLSNYFGTNNKQGFNEYLNKVRIEKSIEWLENGSTPIAEISSLVGYSDQSYFSRVFKNLIGTSPSKYRRQYLLAARRRK